MGPTPFDLSSIAQSVSDNTTSVENRYNQLGLGGSTMEGQDVTGAQQMGTALTGQEQTQDVSNPALNPALQPPINSLVGVQSGSQGSSSSGLGGLIGGLGSALGGLFG